MQSIEISNDKVNNLLSYLAEVEIQSNYEINQYESNTNLSPFKESYIFHTTNKEKDEFPINSLQSLYNQPLGSDYYSPTTVEKSMLNYKETRSKISMMKIELEQANSTIEDFKQFIKKIKSDNKLNLANEQNKYNDLIEKQKNE